MRKLITGFAAVAAFGLALSGAQACSWHESHVSASVSTPEEGVVMSTHDAAAPTAEQAEATDCLADLTGCVTAQE